MAIAGSSGLLISIKQFNKQEQQQEQPENMHPEIPKDQQERYEKLRELGIPETPIEKSEPTSSAPIIEMQPTQSTVQKQTQTTESFAYLGDEWQKKPENNGHKEAFSLETFDGIANDEAKLALRNMKHKKVFFEAELQENGEMKVTKLKIKGITTGTENTIVPKQPEPKTPVKPETQLHRMRP
jgi:hypothetical protein